MNERDAFLKVLAENEDDTMARLVYADWLDENGDHEEADRQRKWPAAKEWLVRFCQANNQSPDDEAYEQVIPYKELLELGHEGVKNAEDDGKFWFSCGNNNTMCDSLRDNSKAYWQNWSIVTGIPLPPDVEAKSSFSCGC